MEPGFRVGGGNEAHQVMHELSQRALEITMVLNNQYHSYEEIVRLMSELTGKKSISGRMYGWGKCDRAAESFYRRRRIIAAGAVVTKEVPANMIATGVPVKVIRGIL